MSSFSHFTHIKNDIPMKELFMFDIETAGEYKSFDDFKKNDERGASLFEGKWERMGWDQKFSIEDSYLDQSGIMSTYGRICCISFGYLDNSGHKQIKSFYGEDERHIVESFNNLLNKIQQKNFNLSGFRITYFDIPWILHKLHKYEITPADIIRPYEKKPWEMRIVDMADDWKQKFAYAFSFEEMCYELGVKSPKTKMDGSLVHEYYHSGRLEEIKEYCEMDVSSSIDAGLKLYR